VKISRIARVDRRRRPLAWVEFGSFAWAAGGEAGCVLVSKGCDAPKDVVTAS
jgi:hypothetical protein